MRLIPYKWELIALLWMAFMLNQADRQVFSVVLKSIQRDLHLSDGQLGLIASILFWTLGLLFPVAGYIGDRFSKRWIISASLLFWSTATLCTGLSTTAAHLVMLRSLATGGGEAFYAPSAFALIAAFHRATRALAMSIHQTAVYVGFIISGALGGWISQNWGWRAAFYCFGSFGMLFALVLAIRLRDPSKVITPEQGARSAQALPTPREAISVLLRTPTAMLLTLAYSTMIFVHLSYLTWSPTFFQEKFGLSEARAGFLSMFPFQAAAFVGVLTGGAISDCWVRSRRTARLDTLCLGLSGSIPFVCLFALGVDPGMACLGLVGFGLFRGVYDSNIYTTLFDVIPPRLRASANGIMSTIGFAAGAFSPYLTGLTKPRFGLSAVFVVLALIHILGVAAIVLARARFFAADYLTEEGEAAVVT
jgi:MFS transporter, Spinster family, sphingosine-1-phosphate transporter